jgi:hypothetical protein
VVGLVWLYFADNGTTEEEEVTIREDRSYFYPLAGMFCFLPRRGNLWVPSGSATRFSEEPSELSAGGLERSLLFF